MRLKQLTLCLLGLSLSACSSHMLKSNAANSNLDASQRAIQGFNAIYEYPSFDYRGQVKVQMDQKNKKTQQGLAQQKGLDPAIEKKLDQYLKQQNIQLTAQQKKDLYQSIVKNDTSGLGDYLTKGAEVVQNILNDVQIRYDGTVNYRQKMASFNLETKYNKPNLSVEMRIPTILDLNEYRFYTQIFSLMPYLANPQDQDKYAYYDFSKYKKDISKVNAQALIEFLKQSGATTYVLAPKDQIENVSVTAAEKQAGVVEKIRLHTSAEELLLQGKLYASINRQYFMNTVLGLKQANIAKILDDSENKELVGISATAAHGADQTVEEAAALAVSDGQADKAMYKLYYAVNRVVHGESSQADGVEGDVEDNDAESTEARADERTVDEQSASKNIDLEQSEPAEEDSAREEKILSEQQCEDLVQNKSKVRFGDVDYCEYHYEIDLLNTTNQAKSTLAADTRQTNQEQASKALTQKFEGYAKEQLVDANQFKQLWGQHHAEITASLPPKAERNTLVVDLALDDQGRAIKVDYDLGIDFSKQKLNVKLDMEILNYGKANKIDPQILKEAKSFNEIFKGSFMERTIGGITKGSASEEDSEQSYLSVDERLAQLAEQVFTQSGSYEKTYKAVFISKLTAEKPDLVKQYSAQDLQEIAAVYAYSYSDEEIYNLKGAALKHIEVLKKKHHLEDDHQYDDDFGNSIDEIVVKVWKDKQSVLEIQKLQKQYKTTEAVFTQYYTQKFEAENDIEKGQRAEFSKTVNVLAKSYRALMNGKFTDQLVTSLNENSVEFIDYDLFKQTYQALSDAQLK